MWAPQHEELSEVLGEPRIHAEAAWRDLLMVSEWTRANSFQLSTLRNEAEPLVLRTGSRMRRQDRWALGWRPLLPGLQKARLPKSVGVLLNQRKGSECAPNLYSLGWVWLPLATAQNQLEDAECEHCSQIPRVGLAGSQWCPTRLVP